MEQNTFQRRRYPRVNVTLPVEYRYEKKTKRVLAKTIGEGGLMLSLSENIPVESKLNLNLFLPNMSPSSSVLYNLKAKAKIVWNQEEEGEHHLGVSFIDITEGDRDILRAFISKYKEI
ncbi:MAG: PilZ domain-containing protein [Nitrospirae bacterium]|nr:PilZ domain-containing protein [Nitrospirota bacterium]